jgi:hypothetical protein
MQNLIAAPSLRERRRPGRLTLESPERPALEAERLVSVYRSLLEHVDRVMVELDGPESGDLARLVAYREQFAAQLERWRGVIARARAIEASARVS